LLVFSSIFLSESVSLQQLLGIGVIILATYLLEYYTFKRSSSKISSFVSSPKDMLIALSLITVFSLNAVTDKYLITQGSTASTNIFYAGVFTLFFAILLSFKNTQVFPKTSLYPTVSRFLISFCAVLSDYLITLALAIPTALASLIVPLRRTSTFFSSVIGGMIFHEEHLLWKSFCILIMLLGVLLIVL
jgi:drug/metabolite transporter (DMT)-like permease